MPKPFIHINKNTTLNDISSWLKEMKYKISMPTEKVITINDFGDKPIEIKSLPCGILGVLTPLGSQGYIDHISSNKKNLLFYYRDSLQFSTELFNI